MSDTTPRLALPLIAPGQAQKELFHNEALARLDALIGARVEAIGTETPPGTPATGQSWVLGAAPTGDWVGQPLALATWTEGGWRFVAPVAGMTVSTADGVDSRFDGSAWRTGEIAAVQIAIGGHKVVGMQQPAVPVPSGGTTVDSEARAAIAAVISALSSHGLLAI